MEADVDLALPNDTLAALHLLRSRFPAEVRYLLDSCLLLCNSFPFPSIMLCIPGDSGLALLLLQRSFYRSLQVQITGCKCMGSMCCQPAVPLPQANVAPFATKAQLYTVLSDRTAVDRQLDELRRSNAVRVMQVRQGAWAWWEYIGYESASN